MKNLSTTTTESARQRLFDKSFRSSVPDSTYQSILFSGRKITFDPVEEGFVDRYWDEFEDEAELQTPEFATRFAQLIGTRTISSIRQPTQFDEGSFSVGSNLTIGKAVRGVYDVDVFNDFYFGKRAGSSETGFLDASHHISELLSSSFERTFAQARTRLPYKMRSEFEDLSTIATSLSKSDYLSILEWWPPSIDIDALLEGYEEFATPNWDGQEAEPISKETLEHARRVLSILPENLGVPEASPGVDGSIALEWNPVGHRKLHKLFLDIGPGQKWRAYWKLIDGTFGRLPGEGFPDNIEKIFQNLFDELSGNA